MVSWAQISMLLERLPLKRTQHHHSPPPPKESKPFQGKTTEINVKIWGRVAKIKGQSFMYTADEIL